MSWYARRTMTSGFCGTEGRLSGPAAKTTIERGAPDLNGGNQIVEALHLKVAGVGVEPQRRAAEPLLRVDGDLGSPEHSDRGDPVV